MNNKMFVCEDCVFVFQTHSPMKKKPFCPNCGENIEVRKYSADRITKREKGDKLVKPVWTPPELELLDKIISGDLQSHQVSIMIGRSINSVIKRTKRRREEMSLKKV